jgi:hypothetical protein
VRRVVKSIEPHHPSLKDVGYCWDTASADKVAEWPIEQASTVRAFERLLLPLEEEGDGERR